MDPPKVPEPPLKMPEIMLLIPPVGPEMTVDPVVPVPTVNDPDPVDPVDPVDGNNPDPIEGRVIPVPIVPMDGKLTPDPPVVVVIVVVDPPVDPPVVPVTFEMSFNILFTASSAFCFSVLAAVNLA